ncbi:MAG: hypothetical protein K8S98_18405 [Planctomycetes bacterium]|nr:hypothetical protein [Planctomycetota bacterium]
MEPEADRPHDLARESSPDYAPDGVDLTLIRWMLSLTPSERLQVLQDHVNAVEKSRANRAPWSSAQS